MTGARRPRWIGAALAAALGLVACGGIAIPSGISTGPGAETRDPESTDGSIGETPAPAASGPSGSTGAVPSDPILGVVDESRLATGETPTDWVEIPTDDDACRQAVPPDWIESGIPGQVLSSDIQATSALAHDTFETWPAYIEHLQATYFTDGHEVLVENDRLFLLRSTERGGASHVLALNDGITACAIVLAITEAGIDRYAAIGIQILYTLAEIG